MATISEALAIAIQHHQGGRLQAAEQIYRRILQADPNHSDSIHLLGMIAHQAGQPGVAVDYIGRAIRLNGNVAVYHNNLGVVLSVLQRIPEAAASYRRALELMPGFAEPYNNLGVVLNNQGKWDEAVAWYRRALELKPDYAEAHKNLGNTLKDQGRLDAAMACYRRALELNPDYVDAHNNLGVVFKDLGKLDEAIACYRRALELRPDFAEAHNNLGVAFKDQGKLDEAVACYHRALELKPAFAEAKTSLGMACLGLGAFADAERWFREALVIDSRYSVAWFQLAVLLRGRMSDEDVKAMHRLSADPSLPDDERASIHFGLADVFDARKDYHQAAQHSRQANGLALAKRRNAGQSYDPALHAEFVDRLIATFTPAFFDRVRSFGVESARPIFIVGQPRSGTTLLERVLAGHSQVFGAGELFFGREAYEMLAPSGFGEACAFEALANLSAATVQRLAEAYLEKLRKVDSAAPHIVDKMPENYLFLGILATLFPKAKFIHCRRDVRDVAISCWMTNLSMVRWANDPEHIATHFREYQRLMTHWGQVLPAPLLEVDYEAAVADLETAARKLVAWCDLAWEPACLAFHEVKRPVLTASAAQVRQPIYNCSVGRWKNYEPFLGSLFAKLSANENQPKAAGVNHPESRGGPQTAAGDLCS